MNPPEPNLSSPCGHCGRWAVALREAVDWVFIASAFGLLFNLYDSDGIELKASLKPPPMYQNAPQNPPAHYPGFKPGRPSATAVAPPSAGSSPIHLSLEGVRRRYGKAVFVDARPSRDYQKGHIAGAISFDVNDFDRAAPSALPLLPRDKEIVAYCSGGDCDDSVMLAKKLKGQGFSDIKLYEGGFPEWEKAGLPVKQGGLP